MLRPYHDPFITGEMQQHPSVPTDIIGRAHCAVSDAPSNEVLEDAIDNHLVLVRIILLDDSYLSMEREEAQPDAIGPHPDR